MPAPWQLKRFSVVNDRGNVVARRQAIPEVMRHIPKPDRYLDTLRVAEETVGKCVHGDTFLIVRTLDQE